jgi:hypothetical protein
MGLPVGVRQNDPLLPRRLNPFKEVLPGRAAEGGNRQAASGDRQSDDALRVQHMACLAHEAAVQAEEVDRTALTLTFPQRMVVRRKLASFIRNPAAPTRVHEPSSNGVNLASGPGSP